MTALRDLRNLSGDDLEHLRRREAAENGDDLADEVRDGKETGNRDEGQERGEEREEKVVRLLCREIQQIVGHDLFASAFRKLRPAERHVKIRQHAGGCSKWFAT